jgi:hypothetical protein
MTFTIQHTAIGDRPFWYHLECAKDLESATRRARQHALDNGGYVCVKDANGATVFGTDPLQLDRAILNGINRSFPGERARRLGCCSAA